MDDGGEVCPSPATQERQMSRHCSLLYTVLIVRTSIGSRISPALPWLYILSWWAVSDPSNLQPACVSHTTPEPALFNDDFIETSWTFRRYCKLDLQGVYIYHKGFGKAWKSGQSSCMKSVPSESLLQLWNFVSIARVMKKKTWYNSICLCSRLALSRTN